MRKKIILLIIICVLTSCRSSKLEKFDYNKTSNAWISCFKDQVFFSCLKESYKNDTIIFEKIGKIDAFNPYDGLSPETIELSEKLGSKIVINMPPPSMCEGCKEGDNYYMAHCLHYYTSRELDSIAKEAYREYLKTGKKPFN